MSIMKYPYTNLHEINLDWIIEQLNAEGYVLSVNGKHGTVTLTGEDLNRSPNNPQTVEQALSAQGSSIQSVQTKIGVTPLPTTAQTLTGAIAENTGDIVDVNDKIGNTSMGTTATTITGAIREHETDITNINNKIGNIAIPTTAQTLTGAIAEHETDIIGINNKLQTTFKTTTDDLLVSTSSGSVAGAIVRLLFNNQIANINGRIRIKDPVGRPTITITGIPISCPAINGYGNLTQVRMNGENSGSIISDPCYITHLVGTTTATIEFDNYLGDFPTAAGGYIVATFNIACT